MKIQLDQDMHVHSIYSDGRATVATNLATAHALGLTQITCVDHVRADTQWLPEFVAEVRKCAVPFAMDVRVGVEAKFLDVSGVLDLPDLMEGVDLIFGADHRLPYRDTSLVPRDVKRLMASGELTKQGAIECLTAATIGAMRRYPGMVVAHLFSFLPKIGIGESEVPDESLMRIAEAALETDAIIEIDERWQCPSIHVAQVFARAGVNLCASTDSHKAEDIGRYNYVAEVAARIRDEEMGTCAAA